MGTLANQAEIGDGTYHQRRFCGGLGYHPQKKIEIVYVKFWYTVEPLGGKYLKATVLKIEIPPDVPKSSLVINQKHIIFRECHEPFLSFRMVSN